MKIFIIVPLLLLTATLSAQRFYDLLNFNTTQTLGTARYMGMGGAFSSLGGDMTSISQNPAGLGVYRSSEVVITPYLNVMGSSASMSTISADGVTNRTTFNLGNAGVVWAISREGSNDALKFLNLSVSFHNVKNFDRDSYLSTSGGMDHSMADFLVDATNGFKSQDLYERNGAYQNADIPWSSVMGFESFLVNPNDPTDKENIQYHNALRTGQKVGADQFLRERGWVNQFDIALGSNIGDRFYLGLSLGIQDLYYSAESTYGEQFMEGSLRGYFDLNNSTTTRGTGVNVKVGMIARPIDWLKVSLAYHSPMFYTLREDRSASLQNLLDNKRAESPIDYGSSFNFASPMKVVVGASATIARRALVSFDYEWNYQRGAHVSQRNSSSLDWMNESFKGKVQDVHTYRVGVESRLVAGLSARAGFSYSQMGPASDANLTMTEADLGYYNLAYLVNKDAYTISGGLGYRWKHWFLDLTYMYANQQADYYNMIGLPTTQHTPSEPKALTYGTNRAAGVSQTNHYVVFTLGARF